jgi:selenocysteine lyase/cysteine desulfurase
MHPHPDTGLNKYGCAPRVREAVALGNCTASSLAPSGLLGARETLDRMRAAARAAGADGVRDTSEALFGEFRDRLRNVLRLQDVACDIAFCPSGTDAEMLALALVRENSDDLVLNVVTGPSEVGSGTTWAASGKHFNKHVPCGMRRTPGEPVDDELPRGVRVETIRLRAADGRLLEPHELDDQAENLVSEACREGARVLLHVVTHSKTGVYAPSFDKVAELRERFGDQLTVVLDAAQGRLSRRSVKAALELDYMVLMTGSKFYGGPPFSGVLLVPPRMCPPNSNLERLSAGMSDYMTASEVPPHWEGVRASLPDDPNPGLVLRWAAALAQMERYYETPSERRREVMRAFEDAVPRILGTSEHVRVAPVTPIRDRDSLRFLEAATTVFPFFVYDQDGDPLPRKQLKRVFRLLNRDMSSALPHADVADKAVLARKLHIGQPVLLSGEADDERSVLRVALGGPMVVKVATDHGIGPDFDARVDWLEAQLEMLRRKVELVVHNFDVLKERV